MHGAYRMLRSNRRTIAIQILPGGEVLVRCPRHMSAAAIHSFVESKSRWIETHLKKQKTVDTSTVFTEEQLHDLVQLAKAELPVRVEQLARRIGVSYGRIAVKKQRTLWGSCSGKGNLNFNCLLMLVPEEVRDYIIVHELCHRKQMNHSPVFWREVARVIPEYERYRRWLKDNGQVLIGRLGK